MHKLNESPDWYEIDEHNAAHLDAERDKALAFLGEKWILHKDYKHTERRGFVLDRWRTSRLQQARSMAFLKRIKNG